MAYSKDYGQGPPDASYGLIFRLNRLWDKVDLAAENGNIEKYNLLLDRIFCNLLFKDNLEEIKDEEGKIIEVKLSEDDEALWTYLNEKLFLARKKLRIAKERLVKLPPHPKEAIVKEIKREINIANLEIAKALRFKDIGLRKFMFELKLYMKASDSNPSKAMWGG